MNQPNTVDIILGIVGSLGFLLAVFLAIVEFRRYWLRLHLKIQCYKVQYTDNQDAVVLFRLSFVNPASAGKTVNLVAYSRMLRKANDVYSRPVGTIWREPDGVYDINHGSVIFSLPNGEYQMPYDEMLQCPLDIPPHQSRTRWYYSIANLKVLADTPHGRVPILLQAHDIFGKVIAEDYKSIPIDNLKKPGLYY